MSKAKYKKQNKNKIINTNTEAAEGAYLSRALYDLKNYKSIVIKVLIRVRRS